MQQVFNNMVEAANVAFDNNELVKSRRILEVAANIQYNLNIVYSDLRCEELIGKLTDRLGRILDYSPVKNNILFYDCFAWDNRGLTQQYIDAIIASHRYKVLFVHETSMTDASKEVSAMLKENGVDIVELGDLPWAEKQLKLSEIVSSFKPEKVLCHLTPNTTLPLIVFGRFKGLVKYQINLTDHAFWLGSSLFDFSFEFREYGCQLSNEKRHIAKEKLLLLPYYPWQNSSVFQGFPIDVSGKTVLFSGGSFYKMEDQSDTFFNIVCAILKRNPNTVMMLAGDGNRSHLTNLINEQHLGNRFFLLGNRKDICQLFAHSDIYISTYPIGGGLMSQYAAVYGCPILMYKLYDIEQIVCTRKMGRFSFDSIEDLLSEADRLVSDVSYREERGRFFQSLMINATTFREKFDELFEYGQSNVVIKNNDFKFDTFYTNYLDRLNAGKVGMVLENSIYYSCPSSLSWKMWLNILISRVNNKLSSILRK